MTLAGLTLLGGLPGARTARAGEGLSGTWVLAMDDAQRAARDAAIEAAAAKFSVLIRGIARGRIARGAILPERYVIEDKGSRFAMAVDAAELRETDTLGTPVTFAIKERGEDIVLSRTRDGDSVTSHAVGDSGSLDSRFVRAGNVLTVTFTLLSPRLDQPVVYTLSYVPSSSP